jgi:hypothetical protein
MEILPDLYVSLRVNFYRKKNKSQCRSIQLRILAVVVPQSNILYPYTLLRPSCRLGGGRGYLSAQGTAMHLSHLSLAAATDIFMLS